MEEEKPQLLNPKMTTRLRDSSSTLIPLRQLPRSLPCFLDLQLIEIMYPIHFLLTLIVDTCPYLHRIVSLACQLFSAYKHHMFLFPASRSISFFMSLLLFQASSFILFFLSLLHDNSFQAHSNNSTNKKPLYNMISSSYKQI